MQGLAAAGRSGDWKAPHGVMRRHVHGRRKGRKLTARQQVLIDELLPVLRLSLSEGRKAAESGLRSLFRAPVEEVWLEIGFGGGEHLIAQALRRPEVGFLGAEPFVNGVASALAAISDHGLQDRIRLYDDDALPLLDALPQASLGRIFMLFPDPWPKLRHRERRLLSAKTLERIAALLEHDPEKWKPVFGQDHAEIKSLERDADSMENHRALKPGGEFRFASDSETYARAARALGEANPNLRLAASFTSANREAAPDWPQTRYEAKAERAGRSSTFLIFERL
jgi:tRNA (guanine-N7-)-methyltransferase